eukprot:3418-Heterococcus_DN1.PRE.2
MTAVAVHRVLSTGTYGRSSSIDQHSMCISSTVTGVAVSKLRMQLKCCTSSTVRVYQTDGNVASHIDLSS